MPEIMTWNDVVMYAINTMFKLLIVAVIPYLCRLLRAKLKNDTQVKYLSLFEDIVKDAVGQVQQTYVANMKAENLFDLEAQRTAFDMVKSTVVNSMNQKMMDVVTEAIGDFDEYLRNKIEAQVYSLKTNSPLPVIDETQV